jgi:hypothetical protein
MGKGQAEPALTLRLRFFAASLLGLCALAALLFAFLMVAICLFHAALDGRLNDLWAPSSGGNHGPWRHYWPARTFLDPSFLFVPPAAILAAFSYVLRAAPLPLYVWAGCGAFVFNYFLFFSAALD